MSTMNEITFTFTLPDGNHFETDCEQQSNGTIQIAVNLYNAQGAPIGGNQQVLPTSGQGVPINFNAGGYAFSGNAAMQTSNSNFVLLQASLSDSSGNNYQFGNITCGQYVAS